jgi:periplasmic protein TonB
MQNIHKGVFTLLVAATVSVMAFTGCNDNKTDETSSAVNTAADSNEAVAATPKKAVSRKGRSTVSTIAETNVAKVEKDKDGIYSRAEIMPKYPGGEEAMAQYITDNIAYQEAALNANTTGAIKVSFVVDENGKVSDAHVVGDKVGNGLDEEAVRAVEKMPEWTPGMVKGKKVKTRLTLPITFQIEE